MQEFTDTQKDYARRVLKVLVYIEERLGEELDLNELAKLAHFSPFHFHRIFRACLGEPLSAYIKRLRLERAAVQLKHSDTPVIDLALDAGFETHSAFSRAFKRYLGESPQGYRNRRREEELYSYIIPKPMENNMKVDFLDTIETEVLFIRRTGPYEHSAAAAHTALQKELAAQGVDLSSLRFFAVGHDDPDVTAPENVRFDACVAKDATIQLKGALGSQKLLGGKCARFEHRGPLSTLNSTYDFIYGEWLAKSGYKLANRPCVQEYAQVPNGIGSGDWLTYVYLPLA